MAQYPINKEFYPYTKFTPPIRNARVAGTLGEKMGPPRWLWRDEDLSVRRETIKGYRDEPIEVLVISPRDQEDVTACLLFYHGGGFVFGGAPYHYKLAKTYALNTPCKVLFVQYRLAPKNPFPTPPEDCYAALLWARENHGLLGIDPTRIAVGGDSAGGALAAAVSQMARDRLGLKLLFQLMVYPFTDRSMSSESNRRFTDTPMWNSNLSRRISVGYITDPNREDIAYASPIEARSFADLPPAYIETAEFDALHDDGIAYARKLREASVAVELNETKGTMHGFDIAENAPTTRAAVERRVRYMRERFYPGS